MFGFHLNSHSCSSGSAQDLYLIIVIRMEQEPVAPLAGEHLSLGTTLFRISCNFDSHSTHNWGYIHNVDYLNVKVYGLSYTLGSFKIKV